MNMRVLTLAVLALATTAFSQTLPAPDPNSPAPQGGASEASGVFQLKYFTMQYGTGLINATNAGTLAGTDPDGTICANFYAFDPNEEMMACCACKITPNGLVSLDVKTDIYNNMLINNPPSSITVKVLSTAAGSGACNAATGPADGGTNLARGLKIWGTTLHSIQPQGSPLPPALLGMTETEFAKAELSRGELGKLTQYCRFIQILGSQVTGICKACRTGALGAVGQ